MHLNLHSDECVSTLLGLISLLQAMQFAVLRIQAFMCVSFCDLLMYRTYGQHALRELDYTSEATAITPSEGKKLLRQYHKRDANGSQQNNLAFVIGHLPSPREC
jgi:hypothetical protein